MLIRKGEGIMNKAILVIILVFGSLNLSARIKDSQLTVKYCLNYNKFANRKHCMELLFRKNGPFSTLSNENMDRMLTLNNKKDIDKLCNELDRYRLGAEIQLNLYKVAVTNRSYCVCDIAQKMITIKDSNLLEYKDHYNILGCASKSKQNKK
jgi:hypothetical protein